MSDKLEKCKISVTGDIDGSVSYEFECTREQYMFLVNLIENMYKHGKYEMFGTPIVEVFNYEYEKILREREARERRKEGERIYLEKMRKEKEFRKKQEFEHSEWVKTNGAIAQAFKKAQEKKTGD